MTHYDIIEKAIIYIHDQVGKQPSLDDVAQHVGLSPWHLQRVFREWAGVSPKKFLQLLTLEHAKTLLQRDHSLLVVTHEVGLSSTSRLHDLFVTLEGMTPAEYKQGGKGLAINYSFAHTRFGRVLCASTYKGVCYAAFCTDDREGLQHLKTQFPQAKLQHQTDPLQRAVCNAFNKVTDRPSVKLHIKGTQFQLKVWQALLHVPLGVVTTYRDIASQTGAPSASRAVGNAVGANPVAYIIPCHRVLRANGALGGYHWGVARKQAMLVSESVHPSKRLQKA